MNLLSHYRCILGLECREKLKLTLKIMDTCQPIKSPAPQPVLAKLGVTKTNT